MRQGPNNRRPRGRNGGNRRPNLPNRNQTYESSGPDVRIRGNAYQVHEKYLALARDAGAAGDRVMAENYLQHAEHYYRIILAVNEAHAQAQQQHQPHQQQPYNNNSQSFPQQQANDGGRDNGARGGAPRTEGGGRGDGRDRVDTAPRNGSADLDKQQNGFATRDTDPRDDGAPLVEFGEDPRQADPRDTVDDQMEAGNGKDAGPVDGDAPAESGNGHASEPAAAAEEEPSRPPRRRRAAGRQRRTGSNGSAEQAEGSSSDSVDQADLGV